MAGAALGCAEVDEECGRAGVAARRASSGLRSLFGALQDVRRHGTEGKLQVAGPQLRLQAAARATGSLV